MNSYGQNRTIGFGVLIIIIGFMILLHQLKMIPEQLDHIIFSWQMLLVVLGVYNLFFTQSRVFGYMLISVGGFFIIPEIFTIPYNFTRNFWPIILIVVGLFIVFRNGFGKKEAVDMSLDSKESQYIDEFNVFSGSEKKISMKNFKGGKITSIFGGSEVDLLDSELSSETNIIELFYLFGGSTIKVPNDWIVLNKVTAILGGFADKRKVSSPKESVPEKTLILRGFVMFGGGEINSH